MLETYSRAMDEVAGLDIAATAAPESIHRLILTVAVGMHVHSQLLLRLLALAQASHAIRRYDHDLKGATPQPKSERASRQNVQEVRERLRQLEGSPPPQQRLTAQSLELILLTKRIS